MLLRDSRSARVRRARRFRSMPVFRLSLLALSLVSSSLQSNAQGTVAPKQPPKAKPAAAPKPAAVRSSEPEVLTNDSIIKMVSGGMSEAAVIAKINSSAAAFTLDADGLVGLKSANIPPAVVRAMLNWKAPAAAPPVAPPETPLTTVTARQGASTFPLSDKPQAVLFVKSEAGTAKEAVVNVVLGDVGIKLITMGLSPMLGWNPYMGDVINKAAKVGKGLLLNKDGTTKGFEIETLTGSTAEATLKEGKVELLIPLNQYTPSTEMDPNTIEPVVLRLQPRDNEQRRVISSRKVVLKEVKKGRFDLKPTTDRAESDVEQSLVPISVERMPNGIIKIATGEDL
jgi:hypothetical protein